MDHVGVVVDDLEAAISLFVELGIQLDAGTTPVEGDWVDRVVGLDDVRSEGLLPGSGGARSRRPSCRW
jgi:catechol 2,3-dioxygenase-like lactoylglutathione lyase family enzyme